ncbi:hypothetical protein LCGC14_2689060, partial [marine sediment metagenome]
EGRKRRLKFGIKQKLLIYFLMVAIIPLVGVTIYSTLSLNQSYENDRIDQLFATGVNKAEYIEGWFFERKGDTNLLSKSSAFTQYAAIAGDPSHPDNIEAIDRLEYEMNNMIEVYGTYSEMYFVNTSGIIVAQSVQAGWTSVLQKGDDESADETISDPASHSIDVDYTFLNDFHIGEGGEIQILSSSVVHDEGSSYAGIIAFHIDTTTIHGIMHETEGLGVSGETYLINADLLWLTTSKFDYYTTETGKYVTIEGTLMIEAISTTGIVESLAAQANVRKRSNADYRGIAVMGSYHYLQINDDGRPWILVAEIDVSEALSVPNNLMTVSIWIVVIIAIIVAILGYVIAKRFTDPIIRLNTTAKKVAEGDLTKDKTDGKERKGNDEIAVLTRSFTTMTDNIRDIITSSQSASINVSNIATELAASSSEVNAAAEEIASTTQ